WRVGGEFEKIGVARATGRQLTYDQPGGVRDVLAGLVERFEWRPFYEGVYLTALLRDRATVTIEPGGQVELSTAPAEHVGQIAEELYRHLDELRAVSNPAAVAWLGVGVTPFSRASEIALVPRERYAVMADYLPARGAH